MCDGNITNMKPEGTQPSACVHKQVSDFYRRKKDPEKVNGQGVDYLLEDEE